MNELEELEKKIEAVEASQPKIKPEDPLKHTQFKKWAKEGNYKKKEIDLTLSQKTIRSALISFSLMCALLWGDWLVASVIKNTWIGTWEGFALNVKMTVVFFTQIVGAKIRNYFNDSK